MTIQEAIKSGKPFKRKGWREEMFAIAELDDDEWLFADGSGGVYYHPDELTPQDILAEDWEVKP